MGIDYGLYSPYKGPCDPWCLALVHTPIPPCVHPFHLLFGPFQLGRRMKKRISRAFTTKTPPRLQSTRPITNNGQGIQCRPAHLFFALYAGNNCGRTTSWLPDGRCGGPRVGGPTRFALPVATRPFVPYQLVIIPTARGSTRSERVPLLNKFGDQKEYWIILFSKWPQRLTGGGALKGVHLCSSECPGARLGVLPFAMRQVL